MSLLTCVEVDVGLCRLFHELCKETSPGMSGKLLHSLRVCNLVRRPLSTLVSVGIQPAGQQREGAHDVFTER